MLVNTIINTNIVHKNLGTYFTHIYTTLCNSSYIEASFNMPIALKLRTLTTPAFRFQPVQTRLITHSARMSVNEQGQGKSHAVGDSAVPKSVQNTAPKGLEEALPDKVRHTSFASHASLSWVS